MYGDDIFDMDADQITDFKTGPGRGPGGYVPPAPPYDPPQVGMGEIMDSVIAEGAGGVQTSVSHIAQGIQAGAQADMAVKQAQLQMLRNRGQMSQQKFEAEMQALMRRSQPGALSSYSPLFILGAIVVIGGIGYWFVTRRKR
jgi:hypothetical protein